MIVSADLHPDTKSRPLYRPIVPDPAARLTLIITDGRPVPPELHARFVEWPVEIRTRRDGLAERLAKEATGLRLIAVGPEAFLWDMVRVAEAAGLGEGEIGLYPTDAVSRRVQCLHCKTFIEDVTEKVIECPGCGLRLLVRDHFSRRHAAFQGIALHGATRGEKVP